MLSSAASTTALERRRESRENRTESHRARERATSRRRMAVYRARKRAQRSSRLLKLRLGEAERAAVEERSAGRRQEILCDWFRSRRVKFDARIRFTKEVMESFMSKSEMHRVELLVAEYEIAIITGVGAGGDDADGGACKKGTSQKQGGSIRTRGPAETNSTRSRKFGGGNCQAPSTTAREGDRGKLLKHCVSADSTSTQAFVGSSYQELLKDAIQHHSPSQAPGDGDHASTRTPDSTGTQLFDPRLSDEQVNDFLSCFGGNLAEESAPINSTSSNSRAFGDVNARAMPNSDDIDRFFASFQTIEGEAFPAMLPANEEADALQQKIASLEAELETKVFGESNLRDTAPPPTGAETIPSASSRSIFGDEGPGPARPSKTAGIRGEGVAPAGGDGGNTLSGRSTGSNGASIYGEGVAPVGSRSGVVISGSSAVNDSASICGEGVSPVGRGGRGVPGEEHG